MTGHAESMAKPAPCFSRTRPHSGFGKACSGCQARAGGLAAEAVAAYAAPTDTAATGRRRRADASCGSGVSRDKRAWWRGYRTIRTGAVRGRRMPMMILWGDQRFVATSVAPTGQVAGSRQEICIRFPVINPSLPQDRLSVAAAMHALRFSASDPIRQPHLWERRKSRHRSGRSSDRSPHSAAESIGPRTATHNKRRQAMPVVACGHACLQGRTQRPHVACLIPPASPADWRPRLRRAAGGSGRRRRRSRSC